MNEGNFPLQA